ncbi:hypothetical protein SeLEV6574_g04574 [Synchytrium endobioticum]|nr:hypothetical protein SeLEV6574_g04574 [Synchytrium endobioticum]
MQHQPTSSTDKKQPTTWKEFSKKDSSALETVYKTLLTSRGSLSGPPRPVVDEATGNVRAVDAKVAVGEDRLFEVDVETMSHYPRYWYGAVYEVRRGTWFITPDGKSFVPCEQNLARQIEDGYKKFQMWKQPVEEPAPPSSTEATSSPKQKSAIAKPFSEQPKWNLFGAYMNNYVLYENATTAYLMTDSLVSRISRLMSIYDAKSKLVRGYDELENSNKKPGMNVVEKKKTGSLPGNGSNDGEKSGSNTTLSPAKAAVNAVANAASGNNKDTCQEPSSLLMGPSEKTKEEEARKMEEKIEKEDYVETDEPDREIHHLILAIHGIGQKLGERIESVSFVHDTNLMRRTFKESAKLFYSTSSCSDTKNKPTKSKVNVPEGGGIQILPVLWRQKIQFGGRIKAQRDALNVITGASSNLNRPVGGGQLIPTPSSTVGSPTPSDSNSSSHAIVSSPSNESLKSQHHGPSSQSKDSASILAKEEYDDDDDDEQETTLEDITLEGVPSIRMLISDVVLDVLLYMTTRYRQEMINSVTDELNRIYRLFKGRNPNFKGKVHLYGHSLGSVLAFDVMCNQPDVMLEADEDSEASSPDPTLSVARQRAYGPGVDLGDLGSLHQRCSIGSLLPPASTPPRPRKNRERLKNPVGGEIQYKKLEFQVDKLLTIGSPVGLFLLLKGDRLRPPVPGIHAGDDDIEGDYGVSRPACNSLYNIFHPHDPVAYRMEPLVDKRQSREKPAMIPYRKGGITGSLIGIHDLGSSLLGTLGNYLPTFSRSTPSASQPPKDVELETMSGVAAPQQHILSLDRIEAGGGEENMNKKAVPPRTDSPDPAAMHGSGDHSSNFYNLNPRGRIDFSLQEGIMESQYLSALSAHFGYYSDLDIASFLLSEFYTSPSAMVPRRHDGPAKRS